MKTHTNQARSDPTKRACKTQKVSEVIKEIYLITKYQHDKRKTK